MDSSILLLLVKATVLLAATICFARLMNRGAAARRHLLWSVAFTALMLLPALGAVLPAIEIRIPSRPVAAQSPSAIPTPEVVVSNEAPLPSPGPATDALVGDSPAIAASWQPPSFAKSLMILWIVGVVAALAALAISLIRVQRLAQRGTEIDSTDWKNDVARIARTLGVVGDVRIVVDESVVTPMAAGIVRPTVFLPVKALSWPTDRREVVLAHEIAHLSTRDPLRQLLSRAALTLYWFHPLAWIAAREATTACEQACDEAVLSLGVRPSHYAEVLLDFATGASAGSPATALPIVRRNLLEARLMAILDSTPRVAARRTILPAVLGVGLALSIAAIRPSSGPTALASAVAIPTAAITNVRSASQSTLAGSAAARVPVTAAKASVVPVAVTGSEIECERGSWQGDFSGSTTNSRGNGAVDRLVQRRYSDVRVCMAGERMPKGDLRPSDWVSQAERLILETEERAGDVRRMEINRGVTTYSVNGRPAPIDANVQEWRRALIGTMDAVWEVNQLHGQVNSLRGEINSIHGERNSLLGEINSLQGEVNSMQGEINSIRGQENSLRGEINSISGELNSMRGQINSEQGSINSLRATRYDRLADRDAIDSRIRRHEDNIRRIEGEIETYNADRRIREVERRIASFDADGKVAEVQRRIRDFDLEGKTAAIQRRIAQLDVEGQVGSIERDIRGLHEGDRTIELERRAELALQELRARIRR